MKTVFALLWGLIVCGLSFIAKGYTFWAIFLLGCLPLFLVVYGRKAEAASVNKHYDELLSLAEIPRGKGFDHLEMGTAIALNREKRKVVLLAGAVAKSYSYEDIRSWDARRGQRTGSAVGHGVQGTIAAGSVNVASGMQADRETGLFVTVRDINNPEWRISMFDSATRAKWMEILTQEISEGGIRDERASA